MNAAPSKKGATKKTKESSSSRWWYFGGGKGIGGENDVVLDIFKTPPTVRVKSVRIEDDWPVKTVEFEVELLYNGIAREIYLPKSNVYRLWFFIKGHGYTTSNNAAASDRLGSSFMPSILRTTTFGAAAPDIPQLRDFLFANSTNSVTSDMVALLETYLNATLAIPRVRSSAYVLSLLQISGGTFDDAGRVTSTREGWLKVRLWLRGGHDNVRLHRGAVMCDNGCFNCFCVVKKYAWQTSHWKWISLKDSCLAIYDSNRDMAPTDVLLFDADFKLEFGLHLVGSAKEFVVSNSAYVLHAQARHKNDAGKWANQIRSAVEESEWAHGNRRDGSFALPRRHLQVHTRAQWYVDGQDTYAAMYDAILGATKEIFIAGWWICPTTYLLRPATDDSRLDLLLKRRAADGIQIYVLMYKEIAMALTLDSLHAKKELRKLHPNVHVLRDPDFIMRQLGMSHHEKIVCVDQSVAFVGGLDLCFGRWDNAAHNLFEPAPRVFPGKDFSNPRIKDFVDVHRPDEDLMDREANPRMPWHDCHCKLLGEPARDVARHFIQRWNFSVSTRFKAHRFQHILPAASSPWKPKLPHQLSRSVSVVGFSQGSSDRVSIKSNQDNDAEEALVSTDDVVAHVAASSEPPVATNQEHAPAEASSLPPHGISLDDGIPCSCQIVRSLSMWSGGQRTEKSIQNAYIRLIADAHHFVYIENQFFVSAMQGDALCQNLIANALVSRILRAHAAKEPFRVMVVMPLLPAFQGKPQEKEAYSLRGVMHWQYRSICRGAGSIYHQLAAAGIENAFEYIAFFGLRTHETHDAVPHTEEVYIHSKVMVVDDRHTIIGRYDVLCIINSFVNWWVSANINERSMSGDRDSEIAAVVEDVEWVSGVTLGGAAVGRFGHSFRMRLFEEHFGVVPGTPEYKQAEDPVHHKVWAALRHQAMANTNIYEAVFGCLPADNIKSFREMGVAYVRDSDKVPSGRFSRLTKEGGAAPSSPPPQPSDIPTADSVTDDAPPDAAETVEGLPRTKSRRERDEHHSNLVFTRAMRAFRRQQSATKDMQPQLDDIRGHIVYFPLKFLEDEDLEPKLVPAELFQ
ncbi:Aste57867_22973 [Aphanomyces stellatus]|uniref:Phospholipase n=1 Tax=Aphanomyces stellatus TaxID=120398 RepID=A0A485LLG0_9STRA|nr:hypothetical protein As57867_022902 [Aphanomyces stellatus]VFT99623.1 Aste57867_22973 [Aphanomyces stellatus]